MSEKIHSSSFSIKIFSVSNETIFYMENLEKIFPCKLIEIVFIIYRFTTISKVLPLAMGLIDTYSEMVEDPKFDKDFSFTSEPVENTINLKIKIRTAKQVINDFKTTIWKNLKKRFKKVIKNESMMIATFIDPRFKLFAFDEGDENKKKEVIDAVKKAALNGAKNGNDNSNSKQNTDGPEHVNSSIKEVLIISKILCFYLSEPKYLKNCNCNVF